MASQPPPCLLADITPAVQAGRVLWLRAGVFNPAYWDDQSGFQDFPVPDVIDKDPSTVH